MPIHDLGYRNWQGKLSPDSTRWWVITETGLRLAWRSSWLRRLMLFAWLPMAYVGTGFFLLEQSSSDLGWMGAVANNFPILGTMIGELSESKKAVAAEELSAAEKAPAAEKASEPEEGSAAEELRAAEAFQEAKRLFAIEQLRVAEGLRAAEALRKAGRLTEAEYSKVESRLLSDERLRAATQFRTAMEFRTAKKSRKFKLTPAVRHRLWSWLLLSFFRYPQGTLLVFVVGLVAPSLIARDVRSRAFLLYFSRPITRVEYICGKMAVVWVYVIMITTVPALALYVLGVLLSPSFDVIAHTWDLPFRILAASAVVSIPTTSMALAFSSMTSESRYASYAWYTVWIFGVVIYVAMRWASPVDKFSGAWNLVSLYHTLGEVQAWIFGLPTALASPLPAIVLLTGITAVSLAVLFRRVSSPMRI
ncbi:MAG: ABC transporter permease subunit [Planctomycetes bacterium]|nr:ABC transporter permease subunit [Planctomycetota bacterium]